jgi:ElaB/YqjD/DUF883 family membrane-anchored ribosome-binding protein
MDEQRFESNVRDAAADFAGQAQAAIDQGKTLFQDLKANAGDAMERVSATARDLSSAGTHAAAQAGDVVKGVARETGNRAGQAATALYQQGANAQGYVNRYVAEQPVTALLLAAAVGYGLAYLIHRH